MDAALFDGLAALLRYPDPGLRTLAERYLGLAGEAAPAVATEVASWLVELGALSTAQLEELYTITFDLSPVVTLEVGWHLYGEQYERGVLLARLRSELARVGVEERGELPDHLTVVLPLLGRLPAAERHALAAERIAPALAKMRAALDGGENPYRHLLAAADRLLDLAVTVEPAGAPEIGVAP